MQELQGKGNPGRTQRRLGRLHAGPLIHTPADSKEFGCLESLREGSGAKKTMGIPRGNHAQPSFPLRKATPNAGWPIVPFPHPPPTNKVS